MAKDMTKGKPFQTLLAFAVPMVLGNVFQQLYNIVDSIVVGNFVGSDALAAVGTSTAITFLFIAIAAGASIGCSVVISQLFGAGEITKMKTAISTAVFTMLGISILASAIGLLFNNWILSLLNTPSNVFEDAAVYLSIYFMGLTFLFMFNTLNAVFNALGDSKIPLIFLTIASVTNIILDLVFVIRFQMGVAGVAWATLIAQGFSVLCSAVVLLARLKAMKTEEKPKFYDISLLVGMGKIAVPSILQQSVVSVGMLFVQGLVNSYGSVVVAGYTAATKIDSIAIMPMVNVGNAVSTFTAQNLGANKLDRIEEGFKAGMKMSGAIALTITGLLFLFGRQFIGAFVDTASNLDVIDVGVEYLQVVSLFYIAFGFMNISNGILRGSGDMKVFMLCTVCNFTVRVAAAYLLAGFIGASAIWWAVPLGWVLGMIVTILRYRSGKWKQIGMVIS